MTVKVCISMHVTKSDHEESVSLSPDDNIKWNINQWNALNIIMIADSETLLTVTAIKKKKREYSSSHHFTLRGDGIYWWTQGRRTFCNHEGWCRGSRMRKVQEEREGMAGCWSMLQPIFPSRQPFDAPSASQTVCHPPSPPVNPSLPWITAICLTRSPSSIHFHTPPIFCHPPFVIRSHPPSPISPITHITHISLHLVSN